MGAVKSHTRRSKDGHSKPIKGYGRKSIKTNVHGGLVHAKKAVSSGKSKTKTKTKAKTRLKVNYKAEMEFVKKIVEKATELHAKIKDIGNSNQIMLKIRDTYTRMSKLGVDYADKNILGFKLEVTAIADLIRKLTEIKLPAKKVAKPKKKKEKVVKNVNPLDALIMLKTAQRNKNEGDIAYWNAVISKTG